MRRDNLTSSGSICCYGRSEKPEQSLSKYFCIIVLHDCVPKQLHPPPKVMTAFIVSSARSEPQVIYHI